ncbi:hypothetical protein HDU93_003710, partial [Gonapodya sp. JEL0774]
SAEQSKGKSRATSAKQDANARRLRRKEELMLRGVATSRPQTVVRGHTSYLTFASYAHPSLYGEGQGEENGGTDVVQPADI